jgi:hypothetical protein
MSLTSCKGQESKCRVAVNNGLLEKMNKVAPFSCFKSVSLHVILTFTETTVTSQYESFLG